MSNQMLFIIIGIAAAILSVIIILYFVISKKTNKSEYKRIQKLQQGTKEKRFTSEILLQKLYVTFVRTPFLKRYILKLRRRLEIINIDDEYNTRKQAAKILARTLAVLIPVIFATIIITKDNTLLLVILLVKKMILQREKRV